MATTPQPTATGTPRELARYHADVGERRIVGHRVDGTVQLRDEPAEGAGRRYVIEPDLTSLAELEAIVADYVAMAKRKGYIPMWRRSSSGAEMREFG